MNSKLQFTEELIKKVRNLCSVTFNINTDEQLKQQFGISEEKMETVLQQIVSALPDTIFTRLGSDEEIKNICAREFIFFQLQERSDEPSYQKDLQNFISIFSRDIKRKLENTEEKQSKVR